LADAQHGADDGVFQANWVGDKRPHVGMRLQDQWYALDSRGVGAFAALNETLLEQLLVIGEQ
jgi:hypothetical protein